MATLPSLVIYCLTKSYVPFHSIPIKQSKYQYHVHNFFNQRKILDLRQRQLELKRNMFKLKSEILALEVNTSKSTTTSSSSSTTTTNNYEMLNPTKNTTTIDSASKLIDDKDEAMLLNQIVSEFDSIIFNRNENLSNESLENRFYLSPSLISNLRPPARRHHRHDFDFSLVVSSPPLIYLRNEVSKATGKNRYSTRFDSL